MAEKTDEEIAAIHYEAQDTSEPVNGMSLCSGYEAEATAYVIFGWRVVASTVQTFAHRRLFHSSELAENEAERLKSLFGDVAVYRIYEDARYKAGQLDFLHECITWEVGEAGTLVAEYPEYPERLALKRSRPTLGDMINISTGYGVLSGWILIAWRDDGIHLSEHIFSHRELAEKELLRQRPHFDRFAIKRFTIEAEAGGNFGVELFNPPNIELRKSQKASASR